jgi:hypothetical protein
LRVKSACVGVLSILGTNFTYQLKAFLSVLM